MNRILQAAAAGALAFLIAAGCASDGRHDPPLDPTAPLSPREEFGFGQSIAARLCAGKELSAEERSRAYLARVGGVVAAASGRPDPYDGWRFYIVKDAKVAAWSAPGGFVFVTTGALKAATSEDALAALLAQEMAHAALGHALEGEPVRDIRPTQESWPHAPDWAAEAFRQICDRGAERCRGGWTEAQEQSASAWAKTALERAGYATEAGAVPEARVKRYTEELSAVR